MVPDSPDPSVTMMPGTGSEVTASVIVPVRLAGAGVSEKFTVYV